MLLLKQSTEIEFEIGNDRCGAGYILGRERPRRCEQIRGRDIDEFVFQFSHVLSGWDVRDYATALALGAVVRVSIEMPPNGKESSPVAMNFPMRKAFAWMVRVGLAPKPEGK